MVSGPGGGKGRWLLAFLSILFITTLHNHHNNCTASQQLAFDLPVALVQGPKPLAAGVTPSRAPRERHCFGSAPGAPLRGTAVGRLVQVRSLAQILALHNDTAKSNPVSTSKGKSRPRSVRRWGHRASCYAERVMHTTSLSSKPLHHHHCQQVCLLANSDCCGVEPGCSFHREDTSSIEIHLTLSRNSCCDSKHTLQTGNHNHTRGCEVFLHWPHPNRQIFWGQYCYPQQVLQPTNNCSTIHHPPRTGYGHLSQKHQTTCLHHRGVHPCELQQPRTDGTHEPGLEISIQFHQDHPTQGLPLHWVGCQWTHWQGQADPFSSTTRTTWAHRVERQWETPLHTPLSTPAPSFKHSLNMCESWTYLVLGRQQSQNQDRLCSPPTTPPDTGITQPRSLCSPSLLHTRVPDRPLASKVYLYTSDALQKVQRTTKTIFPQVRSARTQTGLHTSGRVAEESTCSRPGSRSSIPTNTPCDANSTPKSTSITPTNTPANSRPNHHYAPRHYPQHTIHTLPIHQNETTKAVPVAHLETPRCYRTKHQEMARHENSGWRGSSSAWMGGCVQDHPRRARPGQRGASPTPLSTPSCRPIQHSTLSTSALAYDLQANENGCQAGQASKQRQGAGPGQAGIPEPQCQGNVESHSLSNKVSPEDAPHPEASQRRILPQCGTRTAGHAGLSGQQTLRGGGADHHPTTSGPSSQHKHHHYPKWASSLSPIGCHASHAQTIYPQGGPGVVDSNSCMAWSPAASCPPSCSVVDSAAPGGKAPNVLAGPPDSVDPEAIQVPLSHRQPTPTQPLRPCLQRLPFLSPNQLFSRSKQGGMVPNHVWRPARQVNHTCYSHCPNTYQQMQQGPPSIRRLLRRCHQGLRPARAKAYHHLSQKPYPGPSPLSRTHQQSCPLLLHHHQRRPRHHCQNHTWRSPRRSPGSLSLCHYLRGNAKRTRPGGVPRHQLHFLHPTMAYRRQSHFRHPTNHLSTPSCLHRRPHPISYIPQHKNTHKGHPQDYQKEEKVGHPRQPCQGTSACACSRGEATEEILPSGCKTPVPTTLYQHILLCKVPWLLCPPSRRSYASSAVPTPTSYYCVQPITCCSLNTPAHCCTKVPPLSVCCTLHLTLLSRNMCDDDRSSEKARSFPQQTSAIPSQTACLSLSRYQCGNPQHGWGILHPQPPPSTQASVLSPHVPLSTYARCCVCSPLGQKSWRRVICYHPLGPTTSQGHLLCSNCEQSQGACDSPSTRNAPVDQTAKQNFSQQQPLNNVTCRPQTTPTQNTRPSHQFTVPIMLIFYDQHACTTAPPCWQASLQKLGAPTCGSVAVPRLSEVVQEHQINQGPLHETMSPICPREPHSAASHRSSQEIVHTPWPTTAHSASLLPTVIPSHILSIQCRLVKITHSHHFAHYQQVFNHVRCSFEVGETCLIITHDPCSSNWYCLENQCQQQQSKPLPSPRRLRQQEVPLVRRIREEAEVTGSTLAFSTLHLPSINNVSPDLQLES